MAKVILLIIIVIFFVMNMGGSGIASAFSASYGSKMIKKKFAVILFTIFVFLGAFSIGRNVVETLSSGIISKEFISFDVALIIILSATLTLTLANFLKIPQSTSMVTVGAMVGAGIFFGRIYLKVLFPMFLTWITLPIIAYILTYYLYKKMYPPSNRNLWIYERFLTKGKGLRLFTIIASCYGAFAIGTNNVANAIGPLVGAGTITPSLGLLLVTPFFGLGGFVFGKKTMETFANEIVPLGTISAPLISFITGTLLILASVLGFPFPYVQLTGLSTLAISSVKNGHKYTMRQNVVKKIFMVWTITLLVSTGLAFLLLSIFFRR
jgi:sulfate permease